MQNDYHETKIHEKKNKQILRDKIRERMHGWMDDRGYSDCDGTCMGFNIMFTEIYSTEDTGETRQYNFRRIQTTTIRFQVKAKHDVAVCLCSDNEEKPEDMYEVFIGGWGGGESAIRRKKEEDVIKVDTPDILSDDEFRTFWIKIQRGTIKVCHPLSQLLHN